MTEEKIIEFCNKSKLLDQTKKVNPFLNVFRTHMRVDNGSYSEFGTTDNFSLFYRVWGESTSSPEKIILCLHGLHSHGEKFIILADKFAKFGWVTIALDLRGHGLSWCFPNQRGDIDSYLLWIKDIHQFLSFLQHRYPTAKLYIVAESMGAAIAILAAKLHPIQLHSLILLSPAVKPWRMTEIALLERSFTYGLFSGIEKAEIPDNVHGRLSTNSEPYIQYLVNDPLRLDKVSPRYYYQVIKLVHQLRPLNFTDFYPTCVFYGEYDQVITFQGIKEFIYRVGTSNKELHYIPRAFHELLTDYEAVRYGLYEKIRDWIKIH